MHHVNEDLKLKRPDKPPSEGTLKSLSVHKNLFAEPRAYMARCVDFAGPDKISM